ncbi:hypothetical protein PANT_22c00185 [Moesziomyces antarcticus T-34]|uniref:CoA-binding domain-containing protein n=1 Tax=Pseudozyma antarctica (strain T-34) TaxID=1151754 RepID=M9MG49_PSEA3|nr:hypothetical protein PANT_22c00185 [Moesziomyces antarcticus T-34]
MSVPRRTQSGPRCALFARTRQPKWCQRSKWIADKDSPSACTATLAASTPTTICNRSNENKMANAHVQSALNRFFDASKFAVVGASKDATKFGNKVLKWYQAHELDVTPIHPKEAEIEGLASQPDVARFLDAAGTSADKIAISVVTPPKISLAVVQTGLQDQGISTFWLQPGAEDAELVKWVQAQPASIQERVIYGGPCILVSGRQLAADKGKL